MKKRLDILVTERGLAESREKGQSPDYGGANLRGQPKKADQPGDTLPGGVPHRIRGKGLPYVSRGGLKLERPWRNSPSPWRANLHGYRRLNRRFYRLHAPKGRSKVYAVDGLRTAGLEPSNPLVVNLERTNARYLTREQIPEEVQFFSVDVPFISLTLILPAVRGAAGPGGQAVCLIKPQFEAGRKGGQERRGAGQGRPREVIEKIPLFRLENGYSVLGLTYSPVKGPEGNIEYLIYLSARRSAVQTPRCPPARQVVEQSHQALDKPAGG